MAVLKYRFMARAKSTSHVPSKEAIALAETRQTDGVSRVTILIFFLSLCIPFAFIVAKKTYRLPVSENHFQFGWETGRVAASVAAGKGFSSPYPQPTGPSALVPPLYTYILAGIFRLFGIYSATSAFVALLLNCLASAATSLLLVRLGRILVGQTIGILAGFAWAFNPYVAYTASTKIWESMLTAFLLTLVIVVTYEINGKSTGRAWLALGILSGMTVLGNASVLIVLPFLWLWSCLRIAKQGRKWFRPLLLTLLGFALLLVPWQVRNYVVFRHVIPLRSNFWFEMRFGNCTNIDLPKNKSEVFDTWDFGSPQTKTNDRRYPLSGVPSTSRKEFQRYSTLGELGYMREMKKEALACISSEPLEFFVLTLRRIAFTWTGALYIWPETNGVFSKFQTLGIFLYSAGSVLAFLGLIHLCRTNFECALPPLFVLTFFPIVYYLTHTTFRYRLPIDPLLTLLACIPIVHLFAFRSSIVRSSAVNRNDC